MKKLNDDIAFWHWARARQAKSGVSWSSYCTPLITEENEYFVTEEGSYFCAEEDDEE